MIRAWGLTHRPHPAVTGHIIATRQASGAQNIWRGAIDRGEIIFAPPPYRNKEEAFLSNDTLSLSRAYKADAVNITVEEAAIIQSYPADFDLVGTKNERGLIVGNAVPPLMAQAILENLWKENE